MKNRTLACIARLKRWTAMLLVGSLRGWLYTRRAALPVLVLAAGVALPGSARAAIRADVIGKVTTAATTITPITSLALGATSGPYLVVGLSVTKPVLSVYWKNGTCGTTGTALTLVANTNQSSGKSNTAIYYSNSVSGTCDIVVTFTGTNKGLGVAWAIFVDASGTPTTGWGANDGGVNSNVATLSTNTTATGLLMNVMTSHKGAGNTSASATPNSSQIQQWNGTAGGAGIDTTDVHLGGGGFTNKDAANVTLSWTFTVVPSGAYVADWAIAAVLIPGASAPTAIKVKSFTVTPSEEGNTIQLKTGHEVGSLGFNLYREQNGQRVKLNSSLLAGTAFLAGAKTKLASGHSHSWLDIPLGDGTGVSYFVEELDLSGERTWYGPATLEVEGLAKPQSVRLNQSKAAKARNTGNEATLLNQVGRVAASGIQGGANESQALKATATATLATAQTLQTQFNLAARPGLKLGIKSEGWYVITQPELVAAGFDPKADANTLQMYAEGVQQPILVRGQVGTKLTPQGDIGFYATGLDTTWSSTRVYWLTWGSARGQRIPTTGTVSGGSVGAESFPFTVEWKPRTVYAPNVLNGDDDNFFGPVLANGGDPVSQSLVVTNIYRGGPDATLQVLLQGGTAGPHNVSVLLNGNPVGAVTFSDQEKGYATLPVPSAVLQEGPNTLTLAVQGGDGDVSAVDSVQLTYPHTYTADDDYLRLTVAGSTAVTIGGFKSPSIGVLDVTDPGAVANLTGRISLQDGSYAVTIAPSGSGTRTLLALTNARVNWPASITVNRPSSWHTAQKGYDMVMITHADFASSLQPLVVLRQGQGRRVAVVDVEDIYDEFNFGEKTPYALKDFLSVAKTQWKLKPRFVLLAGDATYDPKNYEGEGDLDFVPTYLVETSYLETASDDWFADFVGTGVPQMAVGRLPVRTVEDADALVNKIVGYERSGHSGWNDQALLVAGENDSENDFEADTLALKSLVPKTLSVAEIFAGGDPNANANMIDQMNAGIALVNYDGHGSNAIWGSDLFSTSDAGSLVNGSRVPFVVAMTCLNGFFQDLSLDSMAEALINAPGGGALAVWASSGLTESGPQATMNQALFKALYGTKSMTLGEAAATAKAAVWDMDVRRTWILFGDPATKLK